MTLTLEAPLSSELLAPFAAGCLVGWVVALLFTVVILTAVRMWAERPRHDFVFRPDGRTLRPE